MKKIAFIGAGSLGFTRELVRDILTFPLLEDSLIHLMDIDAERLDFSLKAILMQRDEYVKKDIYNSNNTIIQSCIVCRQPFGERLRSRSHGFRR